MYNITGSDLEGEPERPGSQDLGTPNNLIISAYINS